MAFIHCPHCGREVSDMAHKCPGCGTPFDKEFEEKQSVFCRYCGVEILPSDIQGDTVFCPTCKRRQKVKHAIWMAQRKEQAEKSQHEENRSSNTEPSIENKDNYYTYIPVYYGNQAQPQPQAQPQFQPQVHPQMQPQVQPNYTQVIVNDNNKSNGIGVTGFVFALLYYLLGWIPFLFIWDMTLLIISSSISGLVHFLGLIFSFIGMFRKPRGLAIAGFIISILPFIIAIILVIIFVALGLSLNEFKDRFH